MKTAARIGELFGMDPVEVLGADTDVWQIRVAALRVIAEDRQQQAEEANRGR